MKKTYMTFPSWKQKNEMPKRGLRFLRFGSAAFKTDAPEVVEVKELDDTTDPENKAAEGDSDEIKAIKKINRQVKQFNAILGTRAKAEDFTAVNEKLADLQKNIDKMTADKISEALVAINEANTKIWKQISELQEERATEKESGKKSSKPGEIVKTSDVQAFIDKTFVEEVKTHNPASIVVKAPEIFGQAVFYQPGTVEDAFTGRFIDPTLYQRRRKKNLILDNFTIGTIAVPKLIFLVKTEDGSDVGSSPGDSGGAAWILSSEAKPLRSFRVTTGEAEAKKVAIFGTVEDKLLKDVSSLENWIREDFIAEMKEEINDALLNNDTGVNPKAPQGLKECAVQFVASPAFDNQISEPNYIDAIVAAAAAMADAKEEPVTAFVSNDVYYAIMILKDSQDRYQNNSLVYVNTLGQLYIAGIRVVAADSDDIPSTHLLLIGADLGHKILAYGPLVFERGLNADDFRMDRTSYRGYQEFLTYCPTHRENSAMYDTWANIEAAIAAA